MHLDIIAHIEVLFLRASRSSRQPLIYFGFNLRCVGAACGHPTMALLILVEETSSLGVLWMVILYVQPKNVKQKSTLADPPTPTPIFGSWFYQEI
jgi:hypothetical protein